VFRIITLCFVALLAGCAGYAPVSDSHGLTNVVRFTAPGDEEVMLAGTLWDVYPEYYRPAGATHSTSEGVPWAYNNNHIDTDSAFGSGMQNSLNIIQSQGPAPASADPASPGPIPYAAWLCSQLVVNVPGSDDYEDWYLPSFEELKAMHRAMFDSVPRNNMDDMNEFWRGMYWSSTEANDPRAAQYLNFWDAYPGVGEFLKHMTAKVRCVHRL